MKPSAIVITVLTWAGLSPASSEQATLTPNQQEIVAFAAISECATHSWKYGQGVMPIGYTKGLALIYAKSYCEHVGNKATVVSIMRGELGEARHDAITFFQEVSDIPVATPLQRLEAVYTLAIGMGTRESSGEPGAGAAYDKANPDPTALTAEAGLFQTSFTSLYATGNNSLLIELMNRYRADSTLCHADVFKEKTKKPLTNPVGSGPGADFQQLTKTCPAFATEYVMGILRLRRDHYGTLNDHAVEYQKLCLAMFKEIETRVSCPQ
jgi:hypothetical protein